MNDMIKRVTDEYAKQYDERCFEILDKYFGNIPRDYEDLGKWLQEKRNQGYQITIGEDMHEMMSPFKDTQIHYLTIKYDKEVVLKEIILAFDIKYILKKEY